MTVSLQSEVLGLTFYPHPSLKDERTTRTHFSESGIWDCEVIDTQSQEFGECKTWPDVPVIPPPWPPCLWLLMLWKNPCLPLILDKSERDLHHWLHKSLLASLKRKLENVCAQLKATTLSSPIYMPHYFLPSWDQQRKLPSSISLSCQLPPGAFDVKVPSHPGLETLL